MSKSDLILRPAIYKALVYASIFDYPLKADEISHWLVFDSQPAPDSGLKTEELTAKVRKFVNGDQQVVKSQGYYFLRNFLPEGEQMKGLIRKRRAKERFSKSKWLIAKRIGNYLKIIPSIEMLAVTGSLAMRQTDVDEDIDLMMVVTPGTLWTSRLLSLFLLEVLGVRRKPLAQSKKGKALNKEEKGRVKDKICLNLILDTRDMSFMHAHDDVYYSHEILQAQLLWQRQATGHQFLLVNRWVADLIPLAWKSKYKVSNQDDLTRDQSIIGRLLRVVLIMGFKLVEPLVRSAQEIYMKPKRTVELVTPTRAQFHPYDYHEHTLRQYQDRIKLMSKFYEA